MLGFCSMEGAAGVLLLLPLYLPLFFFLLVVVRLLGGILVSFHCGAGTVGLTRGD